MRPLRQATTVSAGPLPFMVAGASAPSNTIRVALRRLGSRTSRDGGATLGSGGFGSRAIREVAIRPRLTRLGPRGRTPRPSPTTGGPGRRTGLVVRVGRGTLVIRFVAALSGRQGFKKASASTVALQPRAAGRVGTGAGTRRGPRGGRPATASGARTGIIPATQALYGRV